MEAIVPSVLETSRPAAVQLTSLVTSASTEAVKATAYTKVHVYRVKMVPRCAAVCPSTVAVHVRLTNVTTVVTESVSPATVLQLQGTSPVGAQMAESSPAATHVIPMSTVQMASALQTPSLAFQSADVHLAGQGIAVSLWPVAVIILLQADAQPL